MTARPLPLDVDDVHRAAGRLADAAHRTPVLRSRYLDGLVDGRLHLKAEHLQRVGAFKFRGAYNAIAALPDAVRDRGVVGFSSGNHAQAVACAAAMHGIDATIVMPHDAPPVKLDATRSYGAEVVGYDRYTQDRQAVAAAIVDKSGGSLIPPFDDLDIMAGQGTVGLELLQQVPDIDLLVVPLGGGGLLAGCAVAATALAEDLEIVGVEPADRLAGRRAMQAGEPIEVDVPRTILDGQQGTRIGDLPFAVIHELVDRIVGVGDAEVAATVRTLAQRTKQVVEPSGASALAAVLSGVVPVAGRVVGVVLSGGNIAPAVMARCLTEMA